MTTIVSPILEHFLSTVYVASGVLRLVHEYLCVCLCLSLCVGVLICTMDEQRRGGIFNEVFPIPFRGSPCD